MMMSASRALPDFRRMPVSVKLSISSVTTEALPARDRLQEIAVGNEGDALPPWPVASA